MDTKTRDERHAQMRAATQNQPTETTSVSPVFVPEQATASPKPKRFGFLKKVEKKYWIGGGAITLIVLVLIGYFVFSNGGGVATPYDFASEPTFTSPDLGTDPALGFAPQIPEENLGLDSISPTLSSPDQDFWSQLHLSQVPELSPGNLEWLLNAKTAVGIFLLLMISLEALGEGKIRKKGQNGAFFFTIVALMAGWLTMPTLIAIAAAKTIGWFVVGVLFLGVLWALTYSTIKSQNDLTPITVALAVFTASLFYVGKLVVITTIGALFGLVWPAWIGVTTLGGVLTLLMSGRASASILTVVIVLFGALVIYLASKEVGKKHGHWSAMMVGAAIIIIFFLSNWGLNSLIAYLVRTQNLTLMVTVVLKVIAPILAWLTSLISAIGFGVAMGDVEVGRSENRQTLGLEKTGTFIQNIADFAILGTIIPLFLGVIIVLF